MHNLVFFCSKLWADCRLTRDLVFSSLLTEEECGRKEEGSCLLDPHPVWLSVSESDEPLVGNVTESCPGQWPWQVSLQSGGRHYCSGTLIHRRWVLAPQHCHVRSVCIRNSLRAKFNKNVQQLSRCNQSDSASPCLLRGRAEVLRRPNDS